MKVPNSKMYTKSNKKQLEDKYETEPIELLVLISDIGGGGTRLEDGWEVGQNVMSYISETDKTLHEQKVRLVWYLSDDQFEKEGMNYPYDLESLSSYRVLVNYEKPRDPNDLLSNYKIASFYLRQILERNVNDDRLQAIIDDFKKVVIIEDDTFGNFRLDKRIEMFSGSAYWDGKEVQLFLEVKNKEPKTWSDAMNNLHLIYAERNKYDQDFREFASEELTQLANDWREEGQQEITKEEFQERLSLVEVSVTSDGHYTVYYDDDDMFAGHSIMIDGSLSEGIESADMVG